MIFFSSRFRNLSSAHICLVCIANFRNRQQNHICMQNNQRDECCGWNRRNVYFFFQEIFWELVLPHFFLQRNALGRINNEINGTDSHRPFEYRLKYVTMCVQVHCTSLHITGGNYYVDNFHQSSSFLARQTKRENRFNRFLECAMENKKEKIMARYFAKSLYRCYRYNYYLQINTRRRIHILRIAAAKRYKCTLDRHEKTGIILSQFSFLFSYSVVVVFFCLFTKQLTITDKRFELSYHAIYTRMYCTDKVYS